MFWKNWPHDRIVAKLFIGSGDTGTYYTPVENFVQNGDYNSFCRMPGLLPIYAPLLLIFGALYAKLLILFLQVFAGAVSVVLLAQTAKIVFNSQRIFLLTFYVYAISTFTSNWDHYGLSDSFGISFLVFATFFFCKFIQTKALPFLFWAGLFITWSSFFRPAHVYYIPLMSFALLFYFQWKKLFVPLLVANASAIFAFGIWTYSNYYKYNKFIVLQGSFSSCFASLSEEHLQVRKLVIAWGGDYQEWSEGSEAEWFFSSAEPKKSVIKQNYLSTAYNYDSLLLLRNDYHLFSDSVLDFKRKTEISKRIFERTDRYLKTYKTEKLLDFYLFNRLSLLNKLLFPSRLDDFPTPALKDMNAFEIAMKGASFLLLLLVNAFGLFGAVLGLIKKQWLALVPLSLIFLIACIFGYVEQRYLTPAYPFMTIYATFALDIIYRLFKKPYLV